MGVGEHFGRLTPGGDAARVERPQCIERGAGPVEEVLPSLQRPSEQIGHPGRGDGLGQVGHDVEGALLDQPLNEGVGQGLDVGPQVGQRLRGEGPAHHLALDPMELAVAHQGVAPGQGVDHVVEPDAFSGTEGGRVPEHLADLGVAGDG